MRPYADNGGFIGTAANFRNTETYGGYVGGLTSQSAGAAAGTRSISLTGIPMQLNDMVIVAYERTGTASKTATTIAGYTTIASLHSDNTTPTTGIDSNLIVAYKFMGAVPDTNLVIPTSGATTDGEAVAVQVWRGINVENPLDVDAITNTQPTTGIPNPYPITPNRPDAIIIVAAGAGHNGGTDTFTAAYLSNFLTVGGNGSVNDATVGMGWVVWPGSTYDPAAWSFSQIDSTIFAANSVTFALRQGSFNAKNSGVWDIPAEFSAKTLDVQGQQEYLTNVGSPFSFVVPADLYQIGGLAIGGGGGGGGGEQGAGSGVEGGAGGGLAYGTFAVTPGETLTITVGGGGNGGGVGNDGNSGGNSSIARGATILLQGGGGQGGRAQTTGTRTGGTSTGTARQGGGTGGNTGGAADFGGGGGGAGGYSGNGGVGGISSTTLATAGSGGGGGGGGATNAGQGYGGGGVGVFGEGTSGSAGAFNTVGTGGSGGANGTRPVGGLYGGGGGATDDDTEGSGGAGARGAVRLVWGFNYAFPNGAPSGIVGAVAQKGINYLPQIDNY